MSRLGDRLLAIDRTLDQAGLPHAFGGAIALAYCTEEPRGTRDIDVNIFVGVERAPEALGALPAEVTIGERDLDHLVRDGQVRLWWDDTPVDVFLDVHAFHESAADEMRYVPFEGRTIPVLDCTALVVFKALFDRTRDWADIEAVAAAGALDQAAVGWLVHLLGADDPRIDRIAALLGA